MENYQPLDEATIVAEETKLTALDHVFNIVTTYNPNHTILVLGDSLIAQTGPNHFSSKERTYNPDEIKGAIKLEDVYSLGNCIDVFPNEKQYTYRDLVTYYHNRKKA